MEYDCGQVKLNDYFLSPFFFVVVETNYSFKLEYFTKY